MSSEEAASKDQSRQWAKELRDITQHHVKRYLLAARFASGRVLDAACGCGYGSAILREVAREVVGVDVEEEAIQWARENYPGEYIQGRIEDSPWTGSFETIVSLETLEHIKDPKPALEAFRKSCTGTLIASVPNQLRYPFFAYKFAKDKYPHFRHYTPREFEDLLDSCGFAVMERFCQKDKWVDLGDIHPGHDGMFMIFRCE